MFVQRLSFIAQHYAALTVFVFAAWGTGRMLFVCLGAPPRRDFWLETALAATLGVGLYICAFQGLGIVGKFNASWVLALVGGGAVVGVWQLSAWLRQRGGEPSGQPFTRGEQYAMAVVVLIGLPTLFAPLAPPVAWDEVMYHLPYAREVARSNTLGIYEWLRYPWFPYNYNLLYAAGLMVYDDVFPHLLLALAGWLSVLMVYRLGRQYADRITACLGAGIWLSRGDYDSAYIDGAVALFVLSACVSLWWWRESFPKSAESARGACWLVLAAFFLGLAAGSKYQALIFLPLVGIFAIRHERRIGVWALALLAFLGPCIYWYARNWVQTGDPFNPIGGRVFGFTNWNLDDYRRQLDDVRAHAKLPNMVFWPMLLAPFTEAWRRFGAVRAAMVFCVYSVAVWTLTSRYPRYMMASYPLIALMAALGWYQLYVWIVKPVRVRLARLSVFAPGRAAPRAAAWLFLAALAVVSLKHTVRNVGDVSPTQGSRDAFLRERVPGYDVLGYLRQHPVPGRLYMAGLSDAVYYAPPPVWGDVFGPWRYGDFLQLAPEPLAKKLLDQEFGAIVIHTGREPQIPAQSGFDKHFELLYEKDNTKAYRVVRAIP